LAHEFFAAPLKVEDIIIKPKATESPSDHQMFTLLKSNRRNQGQHFLAQKTIEQKFNTISSIQRAAHKIKNKSATTSANHAPHVVRRGHSRTVCGT
jgi:hypothetical protein